MPFVRIRPPGSDHQRGDRRHERDEQQEEPDQPRKVLRGRWCVRVLRRDRHAGEHDPEGARSRDPPPASRRQATVGQAQEQVDAHQTERDGPDQAPEPLGVDVAGDRSTSRPQKAPITSMNQPAGSPERRSATINPTIENVTPAGRNASVPSGIRAIDRPRGKFDDGEDDAQDGLEDGQTEQRPGENPEHSSSVGACRPWSPPSGAHRIGARETGSSGGPRGSLIVSPLPARMRPSLPVEATARCLPRRFVVH